MSGNKISKQKKEEFAEGLFKELLLQGLILSLTAFGFFNDSGYLFLDAASILFVYVMDLGYLIFRFIRLRRELTGNAAIDYSNYRVSWWKLVIWLVVLAVIAWIVGLFAGYDIHFLSEFGAKAFIPLVVVGMAVLYAFKPDWILNEKKH